MPPSRRTFLTTAGTVLAASAVGRGHAGICGFLSEEVTMEIPGPLPFVRRLHLVEKVERKKFGE